MTLAQRLCANYGEVFGDDFPIFLCIWHLKRNWLENMGSKVSAVNVLLQHSYTPAEQNECSSNFLETAQSTKAVKSAQ